MNWPKSHTFLRAYYGLTTHYSTYVRAAIGSSLDQSVPTFCGPDLISKHYINAFSIYISIVMRKGRK